MTPSIRNRSRRNFWDSKREAFKGPANAESVPPTRSRGWPIVPRISRRVAGNPCKSAPREASRPLNRSLVRAADLKSSPSQRQPPMHPALPSGLVVRGFTAPLRLADFRLAAFDMDSTLINIECIDEIAAAVGLKAEVAAITEATMRGEIADFKESLRRRVALLKGVEEKWLHEIWAHRLELNPGVE